MLVKGKKRSAKHTPGISRKVMVVLTALVIGVVCYSVTVYAWFQANIANSGNTITTATFDLNVAIEDETSIGDGVYSLKANTAYSVTLTRTGEAKGYSVIEGNNGTWYTEVIETDAPFTFTFIPEKTGEYSFRASWGAPPEDADLIKAGSTVGKLVTDKPSGALSKPQGSSNSEKPNTDANAAESLEENVSSESSVSSSEKTEGSVSDEVQTSDETMVSTEQENGNEAE